MAINLEKPIVVTACGAQLIGDILRVRCRPDNIAVEFENGKEFLRMLANARQFLCDLPDPDVREEPYPYNRMP